MSGARLSAKIALEVGAEVATEMMGVAWMIGATGTGAIEMSAMQETGTA